MIVGYTKVCGHREQACTSFEVTSETFCSFLGMLLLSGLSCKLPQCKIYQKTTLHTFVQPMFDSIPRKSVFFKISISISKLRPVINELSMKFLNFSFNFRPCRGIRLRSSVRTTSKSKKIRLPPLLIGD